MIRFWLSILILKVQRTSMSFKSSFGAFEDIWISWLGFCISILIQICSRTLLWSSLKFWSNSDKWKLRYRQFRISTSQNYSQISFELSFPGSSLFGSGLGPKLKTVIAQLRLSRSIHSNVEIPITPQLTSLRHAILSIVYQYTYSLMQCLCKVPSLQCCVDNMLDYCIQCIAQW